jgi:hypothetical protein
MAAGTAASLSRMEISRRFVRLLCGMGGIKQDTSLHHCETVNTTAVAGIARNASKSFMASPLLDDPRPTFCVSERRQAEAMTWCGFSHQYFRTTLCLLKKLLGLPFNART